MLKPIPTRYAGYKFRSRLEAKWAVLLNRLEAKWTYEPEGYDLDGVWYLPDFWVRLNEGYQENNRLYRPDAAEAGFWLEIKPTMPSEVEKAKCAALAKHTQHCVYLLAGDVWPGEFQQWKWHPNGSVIEGKDSRYLSGFNFYLLEEASPHGIENPRKLAHAYLAARQARFEHGQSG